MFSIFRTGKRLWKPLWWTNVQAANRRPETLVMCQLSLSLPLPCLSGSDLPLITGCAPAQVLVGAKCGRADLPVLAGREDPGSRVLPPGWVLHRGRGPPASFLNLLFLNRGTGWSPRKPVSAYLDGKGHDLVGQVLVQQADGRCQELVCAGVGFVGVNAIKQLVVHDEDVALLGEADRPGHCLPNELSVGWGGQGCCCLGDSLPIHPRSSGT